MVSKNPIDFEPSTSKITGAQSKFSSLFRFCVITFEQIGRYCANMVGLFVVRKHPINHLCQKSKFDAILCVSLMFYTPLQHHCN